MAWPNNAAITIDKLDSDGDDVTGGSGARSQLDAIAQKVNAMLAAIATGAVPWTDANDGPASGLNADLLDGKQGALYGILATAAEWTAQQNFTAGDLTYASPNTDWNLNTHQVGILALAGTVQLNNPTNIKKGGVYILVVNNGGAFNLTWGTAFKFENGVTPTVTSGNGKIDVFTFIGNTGSTLLGVQRVNFS